MKWRKSPHSARNLGWHDLFNALLRSHCSNFLIPDFFLSLSIPFFPLKLNQIKKSSLGNPHEKNPPAFNALPESQEALLLIAFNFSFSALLLVSQFCCFEQEFQITGKKPRN